MQSPTPLQVNNVAVLITDPYSNLKYVAIINQALSVDNPSHHEGLLQPHQAQAFGTTIDDCSIHHKTVGGTPGKQCICVPGHTISLLHDGLKAYLSISPPTRDDFNTYPVVEFTSPKPYDPQQRLTSRRVSGYSDDEIKLWKYRLAFQPDNVILKTLQNTSQLIKSVECEQRDLMRDH